MLFLNKIIGLILLCGLISFNAQSQNEKVGKSSKEKKNEIRFQYYFGYTKTNFDKTLEGNIGFPSSGWLVTNPPIYPLLGRGIGFSYGRKVFKKSKISIFGNTAIKGQKSDVFYNYFGGPDTTNIREDYGGVSYQISYFSNEFGLEFGHRIFEKKEFNLKANLNFRFSADVYDELIFRNFILNRQTGVIGHGCCLTVVYHSDSNKFRRFKKNLSNQYFRFGFGISVDFDFDVFKDLVVSIRPQLQYFSKLVASSEDPNIKSRVVKDGTIYSVQTVFSIAYKL